MDRGSKKLEPKKRNKIAQNGKTATVFRRLFFGEGDWLRLVAIGCGLAIGPPNALRQSYDRDTE